MRMSLKRSRRVARSSRGFTLVELLVVIAILSIMASLLFPAARGALKRGEVATCKSNLRQLHAAASQFSLDHNGDMVMPFTGWETRSNNFTIALLPYVGSTTNTRMNIMHCPTQFKIMMGLPESQWTTFTYSQNHQLTSEAFGYSDPARTNMIPANIAWMTAPAVNTPTGRRRASLSTVPYFMDGFHRNPQGGFLSWRLWMHYAFILEGGEQAVSDSWPHNFKTSVVFLDGHVELSGIDEGVWEGAGLPFDWLKQMKWEFTRGPMGSWPGYPAVDAF
jgi:prepilin-type N-terminal cleavage/methylation domain-containing protein/prepilin-type processing-associated H-X9-DG protein